MPPTNGHIYLADFARRCCENLTIVVCSLPEEPIPGKLRYQWMKEIFPDCNVVHLDKVMPQEPANLEDRAFFRLWSDALNSFCPAEKFDALFASESYGYRVADIMNVKFIPVDAARAMVSVSGTAVRENPFLHWDKLHPVVRPYFLKRVVLVGLGSPEKDALLRKLAEYFNTTYVADYAKTLIGDFSKNIPAYNEASLTLTDISTIARGQIASEEALARQANKIIFVGSELKSIAGMSRRLFDDCPAWLEEEAGKIKYDLNLEIGSDDADIDKKFQHAVEAIHALWPALK
jgi:HTH-type transcriptional repressor of NAD biosynthesis genes